MKLATKKSLYLFPIFLVLAFLITVQALAGITTSNVFLDWFDTAKTYIDTNLVWYLVTFAIYVVGGYIVVFKKK